MKVREQLPNKMIEQLRILGIKVVDHEQDNESGEHKTKEVEEKEERVNIQKGYEWA